jgi:hypothetical protein
MAVKEPRILRPKKGPTLADALGLHGGHMRSVYSSVNALLRFGAKKRRHVAVQARQSKGVRRKSLGRK